MDLVIENLKSTAKTPDRKAKSFSTEIATFTHMMTDTAVLNTMSPETKELYLGSLVCERKEAVEMMKEGKKRKRKEEQEEQERQQQHNDEEEDDEDDM